MQGFCCRICMERHGAAWSGSVVLLRHGAAWSGQGSVAVVVQRLTGGVMMVASPRMTSMPPALTHSRIGLLKLTGVPWIGSVMNSGVSMAACRHAISMAYRAGSVVSLAMKAATSSRLPACMMTVR